MTVFISNDATDATTLLTIFDGYHQIFLSSMPCSAWPTRWRLPTAEVKFCRGPSPHEPHLCHSSRLEDALALLEVLSYSQRSQHGFDTQVHAGAFRKGRYS